MITPEDLERLLRRWGCYFGADRSDEPTSGTERGLMAGVLGSMHIGYGQLAKAPKRKIREYLGADGKPKKEFAPRAVCHAKETRVANRPWTPPTEVVEVENAAIDLYHADRLRGVVLRVEYCIHRRRQREKAIMVGHVEGIDSRISLRRYRHELELGRFYMLAALRGVKAKVVA
jgi:hypothetical protein